MQNELDDVLLQRLSDQFDAECQRRHELGQHKYGPVKFLEVNALAMAMEEIVDLANYARYAWIKMAAMSHMDPSEQGPVGSDIEPDDFSNEDAVARSQPLQNLVQTSYPKGFFNPFRRDSE